MAKDAGGHGSNSRGKQSWTVSGKSWDGKAAKSITVKAGSHNEARSKGRMQFAPDRVVLQQSPAQQRADRAKAIKAYRSGALAQKPKAKTKR